MTPRDCIQLLSLLVAFLDAAYHHAGFAAVVLGCAACAWLWVFATEKN